VPDVAADADPQTGYTIYLSGSWQGGWGGTSAAAPLWAAVAALIDASPFCSAYGTGPVGAYSSALYEMVAAHQAYIYTGGQGLHDVTSGDNHYTPPVHTAGLYPATTGYDMTTGLGTPLVAGFSGTAVSWFNPGLAALMCGTFRTKLKTTTVTKVSPAGGPSSRATTVTITGTGFLPIAGADMAFVGSRHIAASCTSTTRCTVRLPATKPSTVSIRISAETFAVSAITKASHFQFVAAPAVKSLSPTRGTHRGGTRITIRGTNFIGVTAVHFGTKRGTKIRVVSSKEIIVTPRPDPGPSASRSPPPAAPAR
jgi:IPT/TIG domain